MIDFNTEPYNDDYDEDKNFYRILFRPSFAVQARELTQLQTILQKQIARHGDAIFKQGAMVIPGQASVETIAQSNTKGADFVKLNATYNGVAVETFIKNIEGQTIVGSSGVKALIVKVQSAEASDPTTIYVRYLNSGTNNTTKTFSNSEVLTTSSGTYSFQAQTSGAIGKGSLATVERGVYYVNEHFVLVEKQTIVLDKYTNAPTYRIGLLVEETVKTAEQDESLLDNAQNSFNFAAPGAHRYYIDLILTKKSINDVSDQDFVELIRVTDGFIKTIVDETQYSRIAKELADRTYDESGDYTVSSFEIDVREHRNNNRGAWTSGVAYLIGDVVSNGANTYFAKNSATSVNTAPVHTSGTATDGSSGVTWEYTETPVYNRGIYKPENGGNEAKLAVGLEAGKAYVRGFEIKKDSTTYVNVDKARTFANAVNAVVPAPIGNYVLVTNVNNAPPIDTLDTITLYNRPTGSGSRGAVPASALIVGYARARFMEWHDNLPFGNTSKYKLGLFDVQLNPGYDFARDVKSFYYNISGDPNLSFTADVDPVDTTLNQLLGSVTAAGTTVTGNGTSFQSDLRAGDYISVAGALHRVNSIASQVSLTLDSSLTATNSAYVLVKTKLYETQYAGLVYPLPYSAVRSIRNEGGTNDTSFTVYQKFTATASGTSLVISTSGTFASGLETDNFICVDNDATAGGAVFTPANISISGSNATITVPAGQSGRSITVIAAVIRNGGGYEKTKVLTTVSGALSTNTFTTAATAQAASIILEHADLHRIISIKMAPAVAFGSTPTNGQYTQDISERFEIDNGQRSTHYDLARLILKPSYGPPTNPFRVEYEYFEHQSGDYIDVNSYSNVDYKAIPANLRDSIDFRPKVANKAVTTNWEFGRRTFSGTGSSLSGCPKRGEDLELDFSYYLSRNDKIAIDPSGKFFSVSGVPAVTPGSPENPSIGMTLYNLGIGAYTFNTSSTEVVVNKVENKRYTMRDIGKLEKRIDNLEYYTSLSLLESDTQSLKITDSYGLDRMKNGFVVDNFTGTGIGESASPDYYCAIDMKDKQLRPFYSMANINLLEKNSNDTARASSQYKLWGDIATLPLNATTPHVELIKQTYASRLENVNPFAIFTFLGDVKINPPSDEWFETERMPDIVQQVEGNYNLIKTIAEKSGVLGTVWNAWQNEWTGVPYDTTTTVRTVATGAQVGNISNTFELTATFIPQTRTGLNTALSLKTDYEEVADRTVSTTIIPYIRSRNVLVQSKVLKPSTRFYAYFDDIDISSYITPATKIVYTLSSGSFDDSTNVGGVASETKRRINGDSQICLNKGDVISNSGNTASAVVVGKFVDPDTGALTLEVLNTIGTFSAGQIITGSPSNAQGTIVSVTTPTTLVTDKNGGLNFLFNIPNTTAIRFRTGSKELKLIDVATSTGQWSSRGRAQYRAQGILETKQKTINAVRNAELVQTTIGPNDDPAARQTIVQYTDRLISRQWYDPLAQSFLVEQKGGAFITKVDIYFATKDLAIPVTLDIRDMVNGTPGQNVLPFSKVTLTPDKVNLSANTVTVDGALYPTFDTPTTFNFPSPVYVQEGQEYCFVLVSDSNNYKVWTSYVGDTIPDSNRTISEQPYAGVMFKSQNASTWTAEQNQDIKFTIWRAKFDTSAVSNLDFVNDVIPYYNLEVNPIQTVSGTNTVRVWHQDHGMHVNSRVNIKGVAAAINGIPASEINGDKIISNVDLDCYTITTTTNATGSGYGGGSSVYATRNIQYNVVHPIIETQSFSDTNISYTLTSTSGKSVDGSESPYVVASTASGCLVKENNYFSSPRLIASEINETNLMSSVKSLTVNVRMTSINDSLSPVVDTTRASLACISNKINYPTEANINVAALDLKTVFTHATGAFTFGNVGSPFAASTSVTSGSFVYFNNNLYKVTVAGTTGTANPIHTSGFATSGTAVLTYEGNPGTITSTVNAVRVAATAITVGKYVTISGSTSNNGTYLVTGFSDDGTTTTITFQTTFTAGASNAGATIQLRELFADEIAPVGSSTVSKYVTKPIKLANDSSNLTIRFGANIPNGSDIQVYYKAGKGDSKALRTTKYTLANPDAALVTVELGSPSFSDCTYTINNMTAFDTVVVKLVFRSTNSSAVPLVRDFRVVALA